MVTAKLCVWTCVSNGPAGPLSAAPGTELTSIAVTARTAMPSATSAPVDQRSTDRLTERWSGDAATAPGPGDSDAAAARAAARSRTHDRLTAAPITMPQTSRTLITSSRPYAVSKMAA
jgi:hypothetical protein